MQVTKVCQPLDDLRDLAGSDSVDTFVLSYTSLLQVSCHIPCVSYTPIPCAVVVCSTREDIHHTGERPC